MTDRRVFLKVKLKSLAAEARVIKAEENRRKVPYAGTPNVGRLIGDSVKGMARKERAADAIRRAARRSRPWYQLSVAELHALTRHRLDVVRVEARLTGIAYAIIRGRQLALVDSLAGLSDKHWERVQTMLRKYGDPASLLTASLLNMHPVDVAAFYKAVGVKQAA